MHEVNRIRCDFGKKELSPALRNRLTEIWISPVDFSSAEGHRLVRDLLGNTADLFLETLLAIIRGLSEWQSGRMFDLLSPREVLLLTRFLVNSAFMANPVDRLFHAFSMVVLDGLDESSALALLTEVTVLCMKNTKVFDESLIDTAVANFRSWVFPDIKCDFVGSFPFTACGGRFCQSGDMVQL